MVKTFVPAFQLHSTTGADEVHDPVPAFKSKLVFAACAGKAATSPNARAAEKRAKGEKKRRPEMEAGGWEGIKSGGQLQLVTSGGG